MFAQMSIAQPDYVENCRPRAIATPAFDHRLGFEKGLAPSLQVLYRLENFILVHRVNFNPFPDALHESNGEFAAEVFAEFLQALENGPVSGFAFRM